MDVTYQVTDSTFSRPMKKSVFSSFIKKKDSLPVDKVQTKAVRF